MNRTESAAAARTKSATARRHRMAQRLALIEALPADQRTPAALAARFGIAPDTAARFLRNHGRTDLLHKPAPAPRTPAPRTPAPRTPAPPKPPTITQGEILRVEIRHLASFGWDLHSIARHLGRKPDSIRRHLQRHGMTDLLDRIDRRTAA